MDKNLRHLAVLSLVHAALFAFACAIIMLLRGIALSVFTIIYSSEYLDWSGLVVFAAFHRTVPFMVVSGVLPFLISLVFFLTRKTGHAWVSVLTGCFIYVSAHLLLLSAGLCFVIESRFPAGVLLVP
jgi:hypothetical protein